MKLNTTTKTLLWAMMLFSFFFMTKAEAQITLNRADNYPQIGDSFVRIGCDTAGITEGDSGEDVTWDFSNLTILGTFNSGPYISPNETGVSADFPDANMSEDAGNEVYYFYNASDSEVAFLGFNNAGTVVIYTEPQIEKVFPFTYSDSNTNVGTRTYNDNIGTVTTEITADAYGTVYLPSGTYNDVLRVHTLVMIEDVSATGSIFSVTTDTYEWYIEGYPMPLLEIANTSNSNGDENTFVNYASIELPAGGPDEYGYTWETSEENLACDWIDITAIGTEVTDDLEDDNIAGPYNMGGDFQYYWSTFNEVYIGSNGYIAFEQIPQIASGASGFTTFPVQDEQNNFVAPLLCDLTLAGTNNPGQVYVYNNATQFIVSFINVPFWFDNANEWNGSNTFQAIFDLTDGTITFNYQDVSELTEMNAGYQTAAVPASIGMENLNGNIGIQIATALPADNSCVQFYLPTVPLIEVLDVRPDWNNNMANGGFFVLKNTFGDLITGVKNSGSLAVTDAVEVEATVFYANGGIFDSYETSVTGGLEVGEVKEANLGVFPAVQEGTYTFSSQTNLSGDINPSNDDTNTEMVVVDTTATGEMTLTYIVDDGSVPTNPLSWTGANSYDDGSGIFIDLPFAFEVLAAEYFVVNPAGETTITAGFRSEILNNDGQSGSAGTVLGSKDVAVDEITPNGWHRVDFDEPILVEDGSFYASWLMESTGISLGTSDAAPYSRRTYEILGNAWSSYREAATRDLYIKVIGRKVGTDVIDGIDDNNNANTFTLSDAYPNPTNEKATINFNLPKTGDVVFSISNAVGQEISRSKLTNRVAGTQSLQINTSQLASGVYLYSLQFGDAVLTKKLMVK
ncbi:MAG: T9SS type A sorting domain-containing protein [Chitinophagales bacterium]